MAWQDEIQHVVVLMPTPTMSGFVDNYARQPGSDGKPIGSDQAAAGLACLDPSLVPIISTLARSFVVCDRWFSSAPGPTWPNRFFVHAATSNGYIESPTELQQRGLSLDALPAADDLREPHRARSPPRARGVSIGKALGPPAIASRPAHRGGHAGNPARAPGALGDTGPAASRSGTCLAVARTGRLGNE